MNNRKIIKGYKKFISSSFNEETSKDKFKDGIIYTLYSDELNSLKIGFAENELVSMTRNAIESSFLEEDKKNKILNKKIKLEIPVTMIHGSNDTTVPISLSRKVLKLFNNAKKKLLIIKNGDHSLFSKKLQKKIVAELDFFF